MNNIVHLKLNINQKNKKMKKIKNVFFFIIIVIMFSSCQAQRRGVQFYSGDKNTEVISDQMLLITQKKTEYEGQLRRLKRSRASQLAQSQSTNNRQILILERDIKRLEAELENLTRPQNLSGQALLEKKSSIEGKIEEKEERLAQLFQSEDYNPMQHIDAQISQLRSMLTDLHLAEDQMLINMSQAQKQQYFQANLKSGYEAANAYLLMNWASNQSSSEGAANSNNDEFIGIVINEYHQAVTATIRHSSGYLQVIRLERRSQQEITLPFPGRYTAHFEGSFGRTNVVSINIRPTASVNVNGKEYDFYLIKYR